MKPGNQRKHLFDTFSTNWRLIRPYYDFRELDSRITDEFKSAVMCPLCMRIFNNLALNQESELPLTLEHCPPEELGGKPKLLLCKTCNSSTGHSLDINLMRYLDVQPLNNQEPKGEVKLKNTTLKADKFEVRGKAILRRESPNSFYFDLDVKDEYRKEIKEKVLAQDKFDIIYTPHVTPAAHLVQTALLKIAYLLAFHKFGHIFILNTNYNNIRQQILKPESRILASKGVARNLSLPVGFYLIKQPIYVRGILVVFELSYNNRVEKNGIFLNHPDCKDAVFYSFLKSNESKTIGLEKEDFREIDFLTDKKNIELYIETMNKPYSINLERLGLDFI